MFNFLDRHLALTGIALIAADTILFTAADRLTVRDRTLTPFFGSYDAAVAFSLVWLLIAVVGATLFLLGVTRSHKDPPFRNGRPRV